MNTPSAQCLEPVTRVERTDGPALGAKGAAQAVLARRDESMGGTVTYVSRGKVLVVGPMGRASDAATQLRRAGLACVVLASGTSSSRAGVDLSVPVLRGEPVSIEGYLGAFRVTTDAPEGTAALRQLAGNDQGLFDLVLDLGVPSLVHAEVPPPGYFAPGSDPARLGPALAELPGLVGEFDKPKFFSYDPDVCAHGARGQTGCTRCLDACPAQAISSIGERIAVDAHLCQGGGSCAAVCPTGAIRYDCPPPSSLLAALRDALRMYRRLEPAPPVLLLHGRESGGDWIAASDLPDSVLPVALEEVGSTGIETWLCALAFGAAGVTLLITADTPPAVRRALSAELDLGRALLKAMGYPPDALRMVEATPADAAFAAVGAPSHEDIGAPPAGFQTFDEKRTNLYLAIDHLYRHAPLRPDRASLPVGAPFGTVGIDATACTLCMSCVAVCPAAALSDGGAMPQLQHFEGNCVQCGLCVTACPEHALALEPRMTFAPEERRRMRVLHEEQPFCCVSCGKPFATQSMIRTITTKLAAHWMYQDERALRNLQMCDTCRVRGIYAEEEER